MVLFVSVLGFCVSTSFAVDTLEVFALRVQFAEETPDDNSLTTGTGLFNSDTKHKDAYKLDPTGRRNGVPYWKKHFDFANAYYSKASHGNLVIKSRIFPENSSAYTLKKQIIDYNRTSKLKGEKTAEFDEARSRDYLQFVYDAVVAAHKPGDSPFEVPLPKNSNTKRAFMIIHAGASRLVDGGSMGTRHADTPADFMDVYVSRDVWEYLPDTLAYTAVRMDTVTKDSVRKVVDGLVLEDASIDTLRTIMVMSETASQDGLNWGINGILVNQIGRELGLPNTYDVVKGISRLGYFDMMDFAGYNAGNGFFPSMPAAWERAYMGWSNVKEVRPVAGKPVTVEVVAAGSGIEGVEIVKVPLNASEYLLIENRQRSWNKDGSIDVVLGDPDESSDTTIKSVPVDSLNLVFEDSVCVKGKCSVNKAKASGIILDVSSFDAGIPASGIAVWKVNEWFLRENLQYGVANFWAGDTFRDHQFGISLLESDGVLSIGKTFRNALGEDSYDYGSGSDLLPHRRFAEGKKFDEVSSIGATGYANTMTTQGGYTGVRITVEVPDDARKDTTSNAFMGDSVVNYGALKMKVTISIDDGSIEGSEFPRELGLNTAVRGAVFIDDLENDGEKLLVVAAEDGNLQVFNAMGDTLFDADSSVTVTRLANKVVEEKVPLYRVGPSYGPLVGIASDGKDVYSLHRNALVRTSFSAGIPVQKEIHLTDSATVGPMIYENQIFFAQGKRINRAYIKDGDISTKYEPAVLSDLSDIQDMAICLDGDSASIAVVANGGAVGMFPLKEGSGWIAATTADEKNEELNRSERYRVVCTDLDRDGKNEVVAVGSRGTVNVSSGKKILWTKNYKRGASGTSGLKDETSGIAIGDVNGDGYPEVVFLGDNLVYALDRFGLPLPGFPAVISRGSPIYGFFSDPLIVDVTGDDIPEILVPSNDGLVYAFTGKGSQVKDQFPLAAGSFGYVESLEQLQPMSIFVMDAVPSKKSVGPELYAFHRSSAAAFRLQKASSDAAENAAAWTLPAGGNERTGFFDASRLKKVEEVKAKDEISEFFVFPNPVRGGVAKARFEIGAEAKSAELEIFDITGLCVFKQKMTDVVAGRNQFENLDLKALGSDVYTARLQVKFKSGKTKKKLYRIGVIR